MCVAICVYMYVGERKTEKEKKERERNNNNNKKNCKKKGPSARMQGGYVARIERGMKHYYGGVVTGNHS